MQAIQTFNGSRSSRSAASRSRLDWPWGRVDVWQLKIAQAAATQPDRAAVLSPAERERAARFRCPTDRARSVLARGSLRELLGAYLGIAAAEVALACGSHGKPVLADTGCALQFNTTHAGDFVMHAVSAGEPVGIDVERIRPQGFDAAMLRGFLSADELTQLARLAPATAQFEAHRIWTRKEAYLKALGTGFSVDARSVDLGATEAPRGDLEAQMLNLRGEAQAARWTLWELPAGPGHLASLVRRGMPVPLRVGDC